jgi:hypothetical protein
MRREKGSGIKLPSIPVAFNTTAYRKPPHCGRGRETTDVAAAAEDAGNGRTTASGSAGLGVTPRALSRSRLKFSAAAATATGSHSTSRCSRANLAVASSASGSSSAATANTPATVVGHPTRDRFSARAYRGFRCAVVLARVCLFLGSSRSNGSLPPVLRGNHVPQGAAPVRVASRKLQ